MATEADRAADAETQVRLYGQRISEPDSEVVDLLYCGFKTGLNEARLPTARVLHFRQADVLDSGDVPDYTIAGVPVSYFDVPINAEVHESRPQRINLAAEIAAATGGTFATLVGTPPLQRGADMTQLESLSHDELLTMVRSWMSGAATGGAPGARPTDSIAGVVGETMRQSYSWTSGGIGGPRPDPWGSDPD